VSYQAENELQNSKRRHLNDVSELLQFLDAQKPPKEPPERKEKAFKFKRPGPLSVSAQALVIYLRFGRLDSDRNKWLKPLEVLKRTGVRPSAQSNIITRWRRRGFRVESHIGRRGKQQLLN